MTNLPKWPPGASCNKLSLWTLQVSTPGRFLAVLLMRLFSSPWIMRGPFLMTYLEFLIFPWPCLTFLESLDLLSSAPTPNLPKTLNNVLVVSTFKLFNTNGSSGTSMTLCPLAKTRGVQAVEAKADATACLFYVRLIFLCHLLHVLMGANILPFLHWFAKAPYPDLLVPDPEILGTLATALPVPQDSAECSCPAFQ